MKTVTQEDYKKFHKVCRLAFKEVSETRSFHHTKHRQQALRSLNSLMHRTRKMSDEDLVADILSDGQVLSDMKKKLDKLRKYVAKHSYKSYNWNRFKTPTKSRDEYGHDEHAHIRAKNCKKI